MGPAPLIPWSSHDETSNVLCGSLDAGRAQHDNGHLPELFVTQARQERMAVYRHAQRRYRPDRRQFEQLVMETLESLPDELKGRIENVAIVVEDEPRSGESLLGLYEGIALPHRAESYNLAPPDRITIFRRSILAVALRGSRRSSRDSWWQSLLCS